MEIERVPYTTSDISLASYLLCCGVNLVGIDRSNPRRSTFLFASPMLSNWQTGVATVNAVAYQNCYETLKRKLFEGERR